MPFNVSHVGHISAHNVEALLEAAKEDPSLLPSFMAPSDVVKSTDIKTNEAEGKNPVTNPSTSVGEETGNTREQQPVPITRAPSISKPKPKPRPRSIAGSGLDEEPGEEVSANAPPAVPRRVEKGKSGEASDSGVSSVSLPETPPRVDPRTAPPVKAKPKVEPKPTAVALRRQERAPAPQPVSLPVFSNVETGTARGVANETLNTSGSESRPAILNPESECETDLPETSVFSANGSQRGSPREHGPKNAGPPPIPPRVDLN